MKMSELKIGQRIVSSSGNKGHVVGIIGNNQYSENFLQIEWAYLKKGILVEFESLGLIHYKNQAVFDLDFR